MSGWNEARMAIVSRFRALWVANGQPRTPVEYPNQPAFQPPEGPWVRLSMQLGVGERKSIGSPGRFQWTGFVAVQVFVPRGSGDGNASTLADAAAAIFQDQTLEAGGAIRFRAASIREIGASDRWWQVNVTIPFERDRRI